MPDGFAPQQLMFQSTRPRGARQMGASGTMRVKGFNPRAREGRDSDCNIHDETYGEFQSTRPRGARPVNA